MWGGSPAHRLKVMHDQGRSASSPQRNVLRAVRGRWSRRACPVTQADPEVQSARMVPHARKSSVTRSYSWKVRPTRGCPFWWTLRVAAGDCSSERWSTGSTISSCVGAGGSWAAVRDSMTSPAPRINPRDKANPAAVSRRFPCRLKRMVLIFPLPFLFAGGVPTMSTTLAIFVPECSGLCLLLVYWTRFGGKWLHGGAIRG